MGAPLAVQEDLMRRLSSEMEAESQRLADLGISPQLGVHQVVGTPLPNQPAPLPLFEPSGSTGAVKLHEHSLDMAVAYETARSTQALSPTSHFCLQQRTDDEKDDARQRALLVLDDWLTTPRVPSTMPERMVRVMFPNGERRVWKHSKLEAEYTRAVLDDVKAPWTAELEDEEIRVRGRRKVYVLTGSLLHRLRDIEHYLTTTRTSVDADGVERETKHFHFKIVKLVTHEGAELLGLEVPLSNIAALNAKADTRNDAEGE